MLVGTGAAAALEFVQQPVSGTASIVLAPAITVRAVDAIGNAVSTRIGALRAAELGEPHERLRKI